MSSSSPVKRAGCNLLFVLTISYIVLVCDLSSSWKVWFTVFAWYVMFLLIVFWMIRRGSRIACIIILLGCILTVPFLLLIAVFGNESSIFLSGVFLAAAVYYGVIMIQLLIALFKKKFPADPEFLTSLNFFQIKQIFQNKNQLVVLIRSFFKPFHAVFAALALISSIYVCWYNFHPTNSFKSKDGPAGKVYRAIHERGYEKDDTYLYAADWPYTFNRPFPVGGDSSLEASQHWSADGSLLYRIYRDDQNGSYYISDLYDYREHQWHNFSSNGDKYKWHNFFSRKIDNMSKTEKLVKERGGHGPEVSCLWE